VLDHFSEPSINSEVSDDYAIPPDAFSSETNSLDLALSSGFRTHSANISSSSGLGAPPTIISSNSSSSQVHNSVESSPRKESLEKSGYLTKLGGKLKTWRKRWFVLKNGTLSYWKSQVRCSKYKFFVLAIADKNVAIIFSRVLTFGTLFYDKPTQIMTPKIP